MSSVQNLETTVIKTEPGVTVHDQHKTIVGSVSDVHLSFREGLMSTYSREKRRKRIWPCGNMTLCPKIPFVLRNNSPNDIDRREDRNQWSLV